MHCKKMNKNEKKTPNTPKIGYGFVLLVTVGKSIGLKMCCIIVLSKENAKKRDISNDIVTISKARGKHNLTPNVTAK